MKKSKVGSNGLRGGENGLNSVTAMEHVKSFMQVMSHGPENLQHQYTGVHDKEESLGVNSQIKGEPIENNPDGIPFFASQSKVTADSPEDVRLRYLFIYCIELTI